MNFTFKVGDIVTHIGHPQSNQYILVKGFDPTAKSFRIWWADAYDPDTKTSNKNKRIRVYSPDLIRIGRPIDEEKLRIKSEEYARKKLLAKIRRENDEKLREIRKSSKSNLLSMKPNFRR